MIITRTIYGIDAKTKSIREVKTALLSLFARMAGKQSREVELQTTYYDALLFEIIAGQNQNVALRWANKLSSEEKSDIRPDAIISTDAA
ncbi:hypothetical protein F4703DRAFT_1929539 [Phycomyces blakesleeanus]